MASTLHSNRLYAQEKHIRGPLAFLKLWWHYATLFNIFLILTYIHTIQFSCIFIASPLDKKAYMGCRAKQIETHTSVCKIQVQFKAAR